MTMNDHKLDAYCDAIASEILEECEGDRDKAFDLAHEHADGSEYAIYYSKAHEVCQNCNTDNGEQFYEDCGPFADPTYDRIASIIAYGEIRCRVEAAIDAQLSNREVA